MRVVIWYVLIGAVLGAIGQFTMTRSTDRILPRLRNYILLTLLWPIILLVAAPDLFGIKRQVRISETDKLPPLHGGDGLTAKTPVVVNCASMSLAGTLIDRFISERHGEHGAQWRRGIETTLTSETSASTAIRAIAVHTTDGRHTTYYFDISRPTAATMNLMRMAGIVPDKHETT